MDLPALSNAWTEAMATGNEITFYDVKPGRDRRLTWNSVRHVLQGAEEYQRDPDRFDAGQRGIRAAQSAMYARGAMSRGWQGQRSQAQHATRRPNRAIMPMPPALRDFSWSPSVRQPWPPPAAPPAQPPHGPPPPAAPPAQPPHAYTATPLHVPPVEPLPEPPAAPPPAYNPAAMGTRDWQSLVGDGRALRGRRSNQGGPNLATALALEPPDPRIEQIPYRERYRCIRSSNVAPCDIPIPSSASSCSTE